MDELRRMIFRSFIDYKPRFCIEEWRCKTMAERGLHIHRIVPSFQTLWGLHFGPGAMETNDDVVKLKRGAKLDVIFA